MANSDGSVVIEFDADVSNASKKIGRLKTEIQNLKTKISEKEFKHNSIVEQADAMRASIKKAEAEVDTLRKAWIENQTPESENKYNRSIEKLEQMNAEYKEIVASADKLAASIAEDEKNLEAMKYSGGQLQAEVNAAEQAAAQQVDTSTAEQVESKMKSIFARIREAASETAASVLKLMKSGFNKLASYAKNAAKSFLSLFSGSKRLNGSFASGIKTMLKYSLGIRSLYALVNKLKSALAEGFKNLAQYSDSTNKSISMVKSALTQLKNSLATAFAPILTTVAPILTQFINMLSTAADYVARLTAALTGQKSYTRAVAVQEDYAASLEGTAKAAEEAAGSLAGFDEINTIATENTASASGASSGVSPSEMFETVEIEPLTFDSWGEAFSAMLDNILNNGIPKLEEGFSDLAGWINDFSSNLYEMFTFPGVQDKVALLGAELATALNGLVNQIDWATLGGAIGAGLNTALGFLVSFIYSFDWLNLGASLATMVNNAISEINWYNVGMLLWAKFKIALETLAGFLLNLDMAQLAQAASNIAIGFFDSMTETLQSIDWFALGEQVKTFLVNIDWAGVAESVFTAIGAAFGAAAAFLWGLIHDAWQAVVNWWRDVAYEDGKFTITGLLEGIWDVIKSIGTWIYDHIFLPFINGFKSVFGIHSPSTVMAEMGVYMMQGLLNGVTSMIGSVVATFTGLWEKIKDVFAHVSDWFKDKFSAAWQAVKDVFSTGGEIFDGIKDGILEGLKAVINALIGGINKVISIPFNGINSALNKIRSVDILGLKPFSFINTISIPQIPKLATGAVIPPNREFLAVLGDQKSGNNIEAPENLIRKIVREEAGGGGDNAALLQAILEVLKAGQTIKVGETVFGRTAIKAINGVNMSAGKQQLLI